MGLRKGKDPENILSLYPSFNRGFLKYCIYSLLFILFLGLFTHSKGQAYVMPAEQLVGLMGDNFSKNETLVITQSTNLVNAEDGEEALVGEEKIWLKSPNLFRSIVTGLNDDTVSGDSTEIHLPVIDTTFYRLFLANDRMGIMSILSEMGVNLKVVSFTRIDRIIAYRIGDKHQESPMLLVEKEHFLPLLLRYRYWKDSQWKTVSVRFDDYRKTEKRWFPRKINLFLGEEFDVNSVINRVQVNVPIEDSIFKVEQENRGSGEELEKKKDVPEKERLKEIIKTLREKYR